MHLSGYALLNFYFFCFLLLNLVNDVSLRELLVAPWKLYIISIDFDDTIRIGKSLVAVGNHQNEIYSKFNNITQELLFCVLIQCASAFIKN